MSGLLALKLVLTPALIVGASLAGRRWGPRIGGWLNALPIVAGPVLLFIALEHGTSFAARTALGTLAGLVGTAGFALAYGWVALRAPWWAALPVGWTAFGVLAALLYDVPWHPVPALAAALAAFGLARVALPHARGPYRRATPPWWDVPLRLAVTVAVVVSVTGLAGWLGPRLAGALTPLPVGTAILLGFTHAHEGATGALAFLRGFLPAMWSFALFCFVLALTLVPLGREMAFLAALAAQGAAQGLVLWALHR